MPIAIENKGRTIYVFSRKEDGKAYVETIDFTPYFYALDKKGDFQSVFSDKVKKIVANNPNEVPKLRGQYSKHFEANVIFTNRFLIDNYDGVIPEEPLRIAYLDIETEITEGFPDAQNPQNKINCIGVYDNFLEKYNIFAVPPKGWNGELEHRDDVNYHLLKDEKQLLNKFLEYLQTTNPDILTAWSGCFIKGQKILMYNGKEKPIEEIKKGDYVIGLDSKNNSSIKSMVIKTFKHKKYKKVYKIKTKHREIIATEEHPFLVSYDNYFDYKKIPYLRVGDFLVQFKKINLEKEETDFEIDDYKFAGLIITDGHLRKDFTCVCFYNKNKKNCDFVEQYFKRKKIKYGKYKGKNCWNYQTTDKIIENMLLWMGIPRGKKSLDRELCLSNIFKQDKQRIKAFLEGVYLGDGTKNKKNNWITSFNKYIREWIVKLYKRLGIYTYESKRYLDKHNAKQGVYIRDIEHIPYYFINKAKLISKRRGIVSDIVNRKIPCTQSQYKQHFNGDNVDDLHFEQIISIEEIVYDDYVFNLETTTNNYVSEDFIVHNCNFDFPYIINRYKKLNINNWEKLARINKPITEPNKAPVMPGRILFDLLWAYKYLIKKGQESFKLDFIGQLEVGLGKEEYEGDLQQLYEDDFPKFLKYNIRDVEIMKLLDEKLMIIKFFDTSRRMARCHFNEVFRQSALGDALMLKYAKGKYCLPTEKYYQYDGIIPGAYVWDSTPGIYHNIAAFDWKCCARNTKVITLKGEKNIENVKIGDYVLGIDGFDKVIQTNKRYFCGLMNEINTNNNKLLVSSEHRIPSFHARDNSLKHPKNYISASLRGNNNLVVIDSFKKEIDDFSLFMGIFFAEGYSHIKDYKYFDKQRKKYRISHQNAISISISNEEKEFKEQINYLLKKFHKKICKWQIKKNPDGTKSKGISNTFNDKSLLHKMNIWTNKKEYSFKEMCSFLRGFYEGDGTVNLKHKSIQFDQCKANRYKVDKVKFFLNELRIKYNENILKRNNAIRLVISNRSDIIRFSIMVGFISLRKQKRLLKIAQKYERSKALFFKKEKCIIKQKKYKGYIYDLALENHKRPYYFANGILTHNSLYPNIIITFNLSLEKLRKNYSLTDDLISIHNPLLPQTFYFEKEKGMIPAIEEELLQQRIAYKKKMYQYEYGTDEYKAYHHLQNSAKVFANGMFGVLKSFSRMSHPYYIASAITTMAQTINKKAAMIAEKEGYKVIYGDSDSNYLAMENHSIEDMQTLCDKVTQDISEWVKKEFNVEKCTLVMEFESIFKSILFCKSAGGSKGSKKRYAYWKVWQDGKEVNEIGVKGFESRRSDTPTFIRKFQKKLFEMVLKDIPRKEIEQYVKDITEEFYTLREEIGIPVGITNELHKYGNIPQVRAARHSNKYHNTNFNKGSKIKWVYLKTSPSQYPQTDVMAFDSKLPEGYIIDYDKMYNRLIKNKVDLLFESIGWCKGGGEQGSLMDF